MRILSVNIGGPQPSEHTSSPTGHTGITKRPHDGPVPVSAPGAEGSGLAGDTIGDARHHGGDDQAVYVYAREDLDAWERELGRELPNGAFGENLTTTGIDVNDALIGERWRIGGQLLLEVCSVRKPCRTFAGTLGENGWVRRFTEAGAPGPYLRVIEPGEVRAGDPVTVEHRPDHRITVGLLFRAVTTEPDLLPQVLDAGDALADAPRQTVLKRLGTTA
ncbi:MOSC domain-containing protein [Streptomyces alkaliterrae]|uniref:MOSC domain-containing protein n=1 Tax=Streptomyces alkaliterrae TaxID=2213162 RepID=A0A5P0YSQ0_9ACTN|nr:MOSC domain-containing protein [Streptomyces alkaliterrae]MBB1254156.1 MOSC domain-containing protein [Streptomyces alkaliterrae]MBB1260048.1 MOSC domain-containing protein [Streptomyces alkaliterrae]MQS01519.1 MOSC domain-containing protein [Streptomyces alkaliterrae]